MNKKWKKITAVMLVIVMLLGMVPNTAVTVYAEEAVTKEQAADSSTDGISGITEEENTTESITEETTTEELTMEVVTTEQKTESESDSQEEEKEAGKAEKTTEQAEDAGSSNVQEPDTADTEVENQTEFRTVERYTLYCMQDTRVYQMADTVSVVLEELKAGDLFTVTAEADAWYRIVYGTEEKTGYVEKKDGCFTREPAEETIMPVAMEEELAAQRAGSSKMIYSDGSWSDGTIWYVNDKDKHYIFCLDCQ